MLRALPFGDAGLRVFSRATGFFGYFLYGCYYYKEFIFIKGCYCFYSLGFCLWVVQVYNYYNEYFYHF